MGKCKDLSESDKDQTVLARRLGQSISKTAALVGCSRSAVVSIYQKWSKEGTVVNRRQGHGWPRLIDARGTVWSDPKDELLQLKLLKKLMLVLIERCQNTQCITDCICWDLLLTSWCQIPQHTFVEYMPQRIRADLTAKVYPHQVVPNLYDIDIQVTSV
ncbi:hypothetical protein DPX16_1675 [Anabarilius grahami]|uniref:Uncharacterized protein n=1 Tax=Anabarilius grahami TaxID=495550 RepID=A0A3N0XKV5_ANAGA|nr:hypothetical protein DPX16_1675 [Anabarilius grahami]